MLALLVGCAACVPQASGPAEPKDGQVVPRDAALADRGDAGSNRDGPLPSDGGAGDRRVWSEDAGVTFQSYLDCLQGNITLSACYVDARGRATAAGPAGLSFARATGAFNAQGLVPADRPGLVYQFCQPATGLFECVSVEYWWNGDTAQIALGRVHNSLSGAALGRELTAPPDSPEMMGAFTGTAGCNIGASGYASIDLYSEAGQGRIQVASDEDTLILSDPGLTVVDNFCQ